MAESSRDTQTNKPDAEKKQPETVLLTAEELRTIAGGMKAGPPPAKQDIVGHPGVVKPQ